MVEEVTMEDTRLGRYLLVEKLGHGGMGEVYRALAYGAAGVVKPVCIKRILAEKADKYWRVESFIEEARLSMQLSHTNIVSVFDFGVAEGGYYLAMEWIDGVDLMSFVRRRVSLAPAIVAYIGAETCRGLARAHYGIEGGGGGIIHRDVKPSNILLSRRGEVKLADFGIAVLQGGQSSVAGTPGYMSPEQEDGALVDGRADIYGLGVSLLEIAIGGRAKKIEESLERVSDETLRIVLGTMLEPDAALRAPSAEIVGKRFERMVATALASGEDHPRDLLAAEVVKVARRSPQPRQVRQELMGTASLVLVPSELRRSAEAKTARLETAITGEPRVLPLTRAGSKIEAEQAEDQQDEQDAQARSERLRRIKAHWPLALFGLGFTLTLASIFLYRGAEERVRGDEAPAADAGAAGRNGDRSNDRRLLTQEKYLAPLGPPIDVRPKDVRRVPDLFLDEAQPYERSTPLVDTISDVASNELHPRGLHEMEEMSAGEPVPAEDAMRSPPRPSPTNSSATSASSMRAASSSRSSSPTRASRARRAQPPAPQPTGTLNISVRPWALVYVNGERKGESPIIGLKLPAGEHELRLENPELSVGRVVRVTIVAGESYTYRADLH